MTFRNDETIQCQKCGRPFHWSYRQQREFREKGLDQPKRCPECIERHREYLRSSERDHPTPTILPQDNPFTRKTPPISQPRTPLTPLPDEKRRSWLQNPMTLWVLIILVVLVALLFAIQIFQYFNG